MDGKPKLINNITDIPLILICWYVQDSAGGETLHKVGTMKCTLGLTFVASLQIMTLKLYSKFMINKALYFLLLIQCKTIHSGKEVWKVLTAYYGAMSRGKLKSID